MLSSLRVFLRFLNKVHQLLIPGRTYDYFDMPTDAIGALIFIILFTILDHRKDKQARTS